MKKYTKFQSRKEKKKISIIEKKLEEKEKKI